VVAQVNAANPGLVLSGCANYGFLDKVVDALRQHDTRWGYVCKNGDCANPALDVVAYHATAGPEVAGAAGIWIADVIRSDCVSQWIDDGFNASGLWSARGRF